MEHVVDDSSYMCWTELVVAATKGNWEMVKQLLDQVTVVKNNTPLIIAAEKGNLEIVKLLIDRGSDVCCKNDYEKPLNIAVKKDNLELVKLLIDNGADVNYVSKCGTPLTIASEVGNLEIVKLLIICGADVNLEVVKPLSDYLADVNLEDPKPPSDYLINPIQILSRSIIQRGNIFKRQIHCSTEKDFRDRYGATAILIAVHIGHLEITQFLLDHGADVNSKDSYGKTPIHIAVGKGHLDIVQLLLEHGADANSTDKFGEPLFLSAERNGNLEIAKLLLNRCTDVNALNIAIERNYMKIVRYLIDHGMDLNPRNDRKAPLCVAAKHGNLKIIELLLDHGADVNSSSSDGAPIYVAVYHGHFEIAQLLLEHGADVNSKNSGITPLCLAVRAENCKFAELLLNHGADANIIQGNKFMNPPLVQAATTGHMEMIKLLLKHNADVNLDTGDCTPFQMSIHSGSLEMVRIMLKHNSDVNYQDENVHPSLLIAANLDKFEIAKFLSDNGADANMALAVALKLLDYCTDSTFQFLTKLILVQNQNAKKPKLDNHEEWSNFWDQCLTQVNKMMKQKMGPSSITFYEFLVSDEYELASLVSNQHVVQEILNCDYETEFSFFINEIKAQNRKGLKRLKFLNAGCRVIAKFLSWQESEWSRAISLNILQHLESYELQNLNEARFA